MSIWSNSKYKPYLSVSMNKELLMEKSPKDLEKIGRNMGLKSTSGRKKRRLWMNCMWFFNTFLGLVALVVAGLIGATITFLLMSLGMPDKPVSYRWRDYEE